MSDNIELTLDKAIHFTYKENPDFTSLCQGDVLDKTPALAKTFS